MSISTSASSGAEGGGGGLGVSSSSSASARSSSGLFLSSELSKTILPLESMERWLRRRPLAPPSSKSAEAFLKRGSTENSSSSFLMAREEKSFARVASEERCACGC